MVHVNLRRRLIFEPSAPVAFGAVVVPSHGASVKSFV